MLEKKKKFGQHFLIDDTALEHIMELMPPEYHGPVVEVGPGGGALTERLLPYCLEREMPFMAIEVDESKVQYLQQTYPEHKGQIVQQDFLESAVPFDEFLLIGNFPYNISTQILFRMLEWKEHIPMMIGMFQLEVAERICSQPSHKTYGITSVLTQTFYETDLVFTLGPEAFDPPPKVSSAVIRCTRSDTFCIKNTPRYTKFVKAGFAMRRKTLRNNFKGILSSEQLVDDIFDKRAEALSPADWVELYKKYRHDD